MAEPAWRVVGPSEDGSPGENVVFAVGVRRDHTGWITAEMEWATDAASLTLTPQQLHGLRNALTNLLGIKSEFTCIDFEEREDGVWCHHGGEPHPLGESKTCFNCHNARMLARDLQDDSYEMPEQHVPRVGSE